MRRLADPVTQFLTVILLIISCGLLPSLRAHEEDERLLDGLRQRQLFRLAEAYCRRRLAEDSLDVETRVSLTVELIRTLAAEAANHPPQQRDPFWSQAHQVAVEFGRANANLPRAILVEVQDALTYVGRGQLIRQELEAGVTTQEARQQALLQLRTASKALEELDTRLIRQIPLQRRRRQQGDLTADELVALQNSIRYHLARVYRNRALCYPEGSVDRVDALTRVMERLEQLVRRLPADDPLLWQARLESLICLRLLGKFGPAGQISFDDAPAEIRMKARAEAIRLELARDRTDAALKILQQNRAAHRQKSAEFDFAVLETFAALARAADSEAELQKWQDSALDMAKQIEQQHGPYWARRANLVLVRSAAQRPAAAGLEVLTRVAKQLYTKGQFDEAIATYDRAAQQALANDDQQSFFTLAYTAARVEHQRQHHVEASRRFRQLALDCESHAQASDAHLAAIWNAAQLAAQSPQAMGSYTELLEEHLATWPDAETADTARWWLGRIRQHEGALGEAIDIYLNISDASEQFPLAVQAAADCSRTRFAQLKESGQPFVEQARLMAARFDDLIFDSQNTLPEKWSEAQRTAALAAARIRLQFIPDGHAAATTILESAWQRCPDAPHSWKMSVRSLLVVALAGQPARRSEAASLLDEIAAGSPEMFLEILDGLAAIAESAGEAAALEIAQLQLDAIKRLGPRSSELTPQQKLRVDRIQANGLAVAGRRQDALTRYAALARQYPGDGQVQEGYAKVLADSEDPGSLRQALDQWRQVDRRSRPHSGRWYRAKYAIAMIYYKLGEKSRAAQLIRYIKATPPGLASTPLKLEFERLLALAEQMN